MSTLKADTLVAADGTSPVTLTKQQASKCWGNIIQSSFAIADSFNVSSATDLGTGLFAITRTNSMSDANYSCVTACMNDRVGLVGGQAGDDYTASVTDFTLNDSRDAAYKDYDKACFQIMGDLA